MTIRNISLPKEMDAWLTAEATRCGIKRSTFLQFIIKRAMDEQQIKQQVVYLAQERKE